MLLLRTEQLPESDGWMYEIKLDGYRAQAIKTLGKLQLRSRNNNDFSVRYSSIANALSKLPNETVEAVGGKARYVGGNHTPTLG